MLVTDTVEAILRWAGNSMTTNGVSVSRSIAVISVVRQGKSAHVGTVVSAEVDPRAIPGLVAASQEAARSAPEAGDAAPLLADTGVPADWDAPVPGTAAEVFADVAESGPRLPRRRPAVRLCPPQCFDDVPGNVDRPAPAFHPAHRGGGDQRQAR